jgi:hypothetical protein
MNALSPKIPLYGSMRLQVRESSDGARPLHVALGPHAAAAIQSPLPAAETVWHTKRDTSRHQRHRPGDPREHSVPEIEI